MDQESICLPALGPTHTPPPISPCTPSSCPLLVLAPAGTCCCHKQLECPLIPHLGTFHALGAVAGLEVSEEVDFCGPVVAHLDSVMCAHWSIQVRILLPRTNSHALDLGLPQPILRWRRFKHTQNRLRHHNHRSVLEGG